MTKEVASVASAPTEMSQLARAIIDLADSVTALRQRVGSAYGVSDNELRAAVRIATEPEVTPKIVADRLRLSTAAVTVIVDHLVERGIAVRMPNPNDRRSTLLKLTPLGDEMVRDELDVLDSSLVSVERIDAQLADSSSVLLQGIAKTLSS
jgi:DNA-binding MarR family transcriptional regulator